MAESVPPHRVTFETKCWEGDYHILLSTGFLKRELGRIDYPFADRRLILNDIGNRGSALSLATPLVENGFLTDVVEAEELADDALSRLGVSPQVFGREDKL